ncbi:MAG: diguanylate cyclase [Candidatus Thiodiazotropha sp.]
MQSKQHAPASVLNKRVQASFAILVILVSTILTMVFFWEYKKQLRQDVRARLHDIVAVASLQIDANAHNTLRNPEQEGNSTYIRLRRDLQRIRDSASGIRYVYTMVLDKKGQIMFVLDAETKPDEVAHLGDIYDDASPLLKTHFSSLSEPFVEENFYTDKWGTWLTGYAPFYSQSGERAGVMGIDIEASSIIARENHLLLTMLPLIFLGITIVLFVSWLIVRWLTGTATQAIDALQASEEKIRNIVDNSSNLFYAHTTDHVLTYISPQTRKFFDCEPEEAMKRWTEFATDNPINEQGFQKTVTAIETGKSQRPYELELVGVKGRKIWVEVSEKPLLKNGTAVGIVGALTDITERKQVEIELLSSQRDLQTIFETVTAMVWFIDQFHQVQRVNSKAAILCNMPQDEIIGKTVFDLFPAELAELYHADNVQIMESGQAKLGIIEPGPYPEGGMGWFQTDRVPYFDYNGNVAGITIMVTDITKIKRIEEALRESENLYRSLIETTDTGYLILDGNGKVIDANAEYVRLTGHERLDEIINRTVLEWTAKHDLARNAQEVKKVMEQGYIHDLQLDYSHDDGTIVPIEVNATVVQTEGQTKILALCRDITERRKQEEHILHQAHFDTLTDLPNRFLVLDRLSQLVNEAQRSEDRVALLFIDLDDFKKINDTLGHDTGDKILIEAASRLQSSVRRGDTVGRLGGDEFIVLLGKIEDVADVRHIVQTILDQFREAFRVDGRELILTASIGIAIYPNDGIDPSELLRSADSAMYHSKEQGRNTYSYFSEEMNKGVSRRLHLEEQMHGALDRGEFSLCYQPKVALESGDIVGV